MQQTKKHVRAGKDTQHCADHQTPHSHMNSLSDILLCVQQVLGVSVTHTLQTASKKTHRKPHAHTQPRLGRLTAAYFVAGHL